jgi:hypothetical protein
MEPEIPARLFLPGEDASGVSVGARFVGGRLRQTWGERTEEVATGSVTVKTGGFDGAQWFLEWPTERGPASLMLGDASAARAFLAGAPAGLSRQMLARAAGHRGRERRFRFGLGLIVALFLLPFLAIGLFWLNADRVAGWAAERVRPEQEQALGDLAFAQMRPGLKLRPTGSAL